MRHFDRFPVQWPIHKIPIEQALNSQSEYIPEALPRIHKPAAEDEEGVKEEELIVLLVDDGGIEKATDFPSLAW